jgi:hypothetical protein
MDNAITNFLLSYAENFDPYVEDECAAYVRYCFADPLDAAIDCSSERVARSRASLRPKAFSERL